MTTSTRDRRHTLAAVALLALLMSFLLPTTSQASEAGDLVGQANASRANAGLSSLQYDSSLAAIAQAWAVNLAGRGVLEHNPNLRAQMPGGWTTYAENVAYSSSATPASIQAQFMASASHRATVLNPEFTNIGVGWAVDATGVSYAVQVFGTYPSAAAAAPVAPAPAAVAPAPAPAAAPAAKSAKTTTTSPAATAAVKVKTPAAAPVVITGLNYGARGDALVTGLQERLTVHGFALAADGNYGELTAQAVKDFQTAAGLDPDGVPGPLTLAALAAEPAPAAPPVADAIVTAPVEPAVEPATEPEPASGDIPAVLVVASPTPEPEPSTSAESEAPESDSSGPGAGPVAAIALGALAAGAGATWKLRRR